LATQDSFVGEVFAGTAVAGLLEHDVGERGVVEKPEISCVSISSRYVQINLRLHGGLL
jgi:hypothetical protein